ncbi:MAG: glycosyl transferase [Pyrinomonas sp.]|uniref:glycosyltransferase family 4 protein n=1 Tax=Pyrinomonas sp. TaxID=2080306 RepID=UPI0033260C13
MRILIATVQVPFIKGGAESHAEGLREALCQAGHEAEIVAVPFKWYPPERILDQMLACRLFDISEAAGVPIDLMIGLKFPAYLIPHQNKVLWILHQHRTAYDLWNHPLGDLKCWPWGRQVRDAIRLADRTLIPQAKAVYANSRNVAKRLQDFCGIKAKELYHPPPHADSFFHASTGDYLFFPSRLSDLKRQALALIALARTRNPIRLIFAGEADNPLYERKLKRLANRLRLADRVEWRGRITEEDKRELYANCLAVVYPPLDEDYGYVTLEAMLSSKAVITCNDSGGPLEFVVDRETGIISAPTPDALASAMDFMYESPNISAAYGKRGRERYEELDISWDKVVRTLLSSGQR